MNHRRGVPRHPALWDGTCSIERESIGPRGCRVIDISIFGLGITLKHPSPLQLVGRRISVEIPVADESVSIYTAGTITNAGPTLGGDSSSWNQVRWILTESNAIIAFSRTNVDLQRECASLGNRAVARHDAQYASTREAAGATPPKPRPRRGSEKTRGTCQVTSAGPSPMLKSKAISSGSWSCSPLEGRSRCAAPLEMGGCVSSSDSAQSWCVIGSTASVLSSVRP